MRPQSPSAPLRKAAFLVAICHVALVVSACGNLGARSLNSRASSSVVPVRQQNPRVNINTASVDELEKLPGIGKVFAERIVAYRQRYGAFRRAEHLIMVQGMSDNRFRKFQQLLRVD